MAATVPTLPIVAGREWGDGGLPVSAPRRAVSAFWAVLGGGGVAAAYGEPIAGDLLAKEPAGDVLLGLGWPQVAFGLVEVDGMGVLVGQVTPFIDTLCGPPGHTRGADCPRPPRASRRCSGGEPRTDLP